jgi:hypothetical protein
MPDILDPQIFELEKKWDSILIATDGVVAAKRVLSEDGWNMISKSAKSRADFVRKILFLTNWLGGADNSTVVALPFLDESSFVPARRDSGSLTAWSGLRTIELLGRPIRGSILSATSTRAILKRPKNGKFKKAQKALSQYEKPKDTDAKSATKSTPSITFLPELPKGDAVLQQNERST